MIVGYVQNGFFKKALHFQENEIGKPKARLCDLVRILVACNGSFEARYEA